MSEKILVLNWKSNKTASEAEKFLGEVENISSACRVILCPDYVSIPMCSKIVKDRGLNIILGAQDISRFGVGSYTGEVNGKALSEFVEYVILGHVERRTLMGDTKEVIKEKMKRSKEFGLKTILCVENVSELEDMSPDVVAFEPRDAIGTGKIKTVEEIEKALELISRETNTPILYGGSVDLGHLQSLLEVSDLSGFLIGSASLRVETVNSFVKILF